MWQILTAAWHDLSAKGRAIVLVVLILAAAGLLALAMWMGYQLDWIPDLLGRAIDGG